MISPLIFEKIFEKSESSNCDKKWMPFFPHSYCVVSSLKAMRVSGVTRRTRKSFAEEGQSDQNSTSRSWKLQFHPRQLLVLPEVKTNSPCSSNLKYPPASQVGLKTFAQSQQINNDSGCLFHERVGLAGFGKAGVEFLGQLSDVWFRDQIKMAARNFLNIHATC